MLYAILDSNGISKRLNSFLLPSESRSESSLMTHKLWAIRLLWTPFVVRGETVWWNGPKMTCLFVQVGVIKIFETFLGKFLNLNLHTVWECISRNQNHFCNLDCYWSIDAIGGTFLLLVLRYMLRIYTITWLVLWNQAYKKVVFFTIRSSIK